MRELSIFDLSGKCSAILKGEGLVHSLPYREELGICSQQLVRLHLRTMEDQPMATITARLHAAWRVPFHIWEGLGWFHELDLGMSGPRAVDFYRSWWGNPAPNESILALFFYPAPVPAAPTPARL